jgi:hypothetical protein
MPNVLIHPETGQAEAMDPNSAQGALQAGYQIPLNDPEGNYYPANAQEAPNLLSQGYSHASPEQLQSLLKQTHYDSPTQKALAFTEGAMETLTGGLYGRAAVESGLTSAQELRDRSEAHPYLNALGQGAAFLAPEFGVAGKIVKTAKGVEKVVAGESLLSKAAGLAARGGTEGALLAIPHEINEALLGDPNQNAESVASHIGMSALIGAPGGLIFGGIGKGVEKLLGSKAISSVMGEEAKNAVGATGEEIPATIKRMAQTVSGLPEDLQGGSMPSKQLLRDSERIISETGPASQAEVLPQQYNSLDDPGLRKQYKIMAEGNDRLGASIRNYEAAQKAEGSKMLQDTVQSIAPQSTLTADEMKGGQKVVDGFIDQYKAEKEASKPFWDKFDKIAINPLANPEELPALIDKAIPGASTAINMEGDKLTLAPWKSTMGWSKNVHNSLGEMVDAINKDGLNLGELRNVKNNINDKIHFNNSPRENAQLGSLKSGLNDYIQEQIPDMDFKNLNKQYAINEKNRETIEAILKGKISDYAPYQKQIVPENILNNLFKNSVATEAAKSILPKQVFNEALGNYIKKEMENATNQAGIGFSSNKFKNFLNNNKAELQTAFSDNPTTLMRIHALTDKMRILPDSPAGNPSQSFTQGRNFLDMIGGLKDYLSATGLIKKGLEKIMPSASQKLEAGFELLGEGGRNSAQLQDAIHDKFLSYKILHGIDDMRVKVFKTMDKIASNILQPERGVALTTAIAGAASNKRKEMQQYANEPMPMNKIGTLVQKHSDNPEGLIDHMASTLTPISDHAPQISQGLTTAAGSAVNFLKSKMPNDARVSPLDQKPVISNAEMAKFNRYADMVEDPMQIMNHIKDGTILPQDI